MSGESSGPIIRASELGQHSFCARSWWLERVQGIPSANVREMASGVDAHRTHGRSVVRYLRLQWLAYALLLLSLLLGAAALVAWVRGG
jgi:hypothetical protein